MHDWERLCDMPFVDVFDVDILCMAFAFQIDGFHEGPARVGNADTDPNSKYVKRTVPFMARLHSLLNQLLPSSSSFMIVGQLTSSLFAHTSGFSPFANSAPNWIISVRKFHQCKANANTQTMEFDYQTVATESTLWMASWASSEAVNARYTLYVRRTCSQLFRQINLASSNEHFPCRLAAIAVLIRSLPAVSLRLIHEICKQTSFTVFAQIKDSGFHELTHIPS